MDKAFKRIKQQQTDWAKAKGIQINKEGVYKLNDNLFCPLSEASLDEFGSGAGNELDTKMKALHSSSALVANFFEHWRESDIGVIAKALGLPSAEYKVHFEKTHKKPKGLGGIPPHLDAELNANGILPVAIEAKFCEPYYSGEKTLKKSYINEDAIDNIWGTLSSCRQLAIRLTEPNHYRYLDAPQLLKHIVGLRNDYGEGNFILVYLWYDVPGEEAILHRDEIAEFAELVASEIDFRSVTYQELFERIAKDTTGNEDYITYMRDRYFVDIV